MRKFDIAIFAGDGIGPDITKPSFDFVAQAAKSFGIELSGEYLEAGADLYSRTGEAFPEENFQKAAAADAIYLAAMGLPGIRYADGTEVGPQHDLRKRLRLYAGVRPCVIQPCLPLPLADKRAGEIDFVIVRESIEGIFAYPRKSQLDSEDAAYNVIKVTREISEKLFNFSFRLAEKRKAAGGKGKVTCVDKANVLSSLSFFRSIFNEISTRYPELEAECSYVDAAAFSMIRKPWDFDVYVTENQFGDILSDEASALMGGMGMAPSGEIGDGNGLFQPCHGSSPRKAGTGKANPTGMVLSGAMMLEYLADRFDCPEALKACEFINRAVRGAYASGELLPYELGGTSGCGEIMAKIYNEASELF